MVQQQKLFVIGLALLAVMVIAATPAQAMNERERFFSRYHQYPVGDGNASNQEARALEPIAAPADIALPSATPPEAVPVPSFAREEPVVTEQKNIGLERPATLHPDVTTTP
jgi:hypothetical protein